MSSPVVNAIKRVGKIVGIVLAYVLIWAGITLLLAGIGIRFLWGPITVDQMMMNLMTVTTDGGGGALVWIGVFGFGVLPVLITLGIFFFRFFRRRRRAKNGSDLRPQRMTWLHRTVSTALVSAVVVAGGGAFASTVKVGDYVKAANSDYDISDYYKEPTVLDGTDGHPGKPKQNLVLVYLESGEATLSDTKLFEKDPFKPLSAVTKAEDGWKSIENFQQYVNGGWTMSGISSTQCGTPLKGTGSISGRAGMNKVGGVKTYLGGETCLGNILKDHGYKSVFMGGANGSFAAKDIFLKDHGYDEELDLSDWREHNEPADQFRSDWGLSDKRLMANAKEKVDELHAESKKTGKPFNLSMLTLDTHEPIHLYDYCKVDTKEELTSVFQCSMEQVADFVDYMKKQGYLEDTTVVLMGDHFKHMGAHDKFHDELDKNPNRHIYNRIWVAGQDRSKLTTRAGVDQLNMFPTILEALGFQVKDREAGLGVSAFAPEIPKDSAQSMRPEKYKELLDARSKKFYERAWGDEVLKKD